MNSRLRVVSLEVCSPFPEPADGCVRLTSGSLGMG